MYKRYVAACGIMKIKNANYMHTGVQNVFLYTTCLSKSCTILLNFKGQHLDRDSLLSINGL